MTQIKNIQLNPELANIQIGEVKLRYGNHARLKAEKRGIGLPNRFNICKGSVVECELTDTDKVTKLVVRGPYNSQQDIVLVLIRGGMDYLFVKTVWLNHTDDNHSTLKLNLI